MAKDDLFDDEDGMVRMTFGEHLEDLRHRLVLALFGFLPGLIVGLCIGRYLVGIMSKPVKTALDNYAVQYYDDRRAEREAKLKEAREQARAEGKQPRRETVQVDVSKKVLRDAMLDAFPTLKQLPDVEPEGNDDGGENSYLSLRLAIDHDELEKASNPIFGAGTGLTTLSAQEGFMAYMKVSIVAGLVLSSWWVIFQLWKFVAEGLYRHERTIVYRAMPMSAGLFLVGVLFCFVIVLPVVIKFFFGINQWLKIEPNIRLSEWLGFATILPVIFGICFELPLVMVVLERVGILRLEDYTSKWRHAILAIAVVAMVATPTTDPGSMMLLMGPMTALYGLGLGMVWMRRRRMGDVAPIRAETKVVWAAWLVAAAYAIVLGVPFLLPSSQIDDAWWFGIDYERWFGKVWRPGTFPTSYLLGLGMELTVKNLRWICVVTLVNAWVLGLAVYRIGELFLSLARRRGGQQPPEQAP